MAVYLVKSPDGKERMVETRTKSKAISHVASSQYTATVISASEAIAKSKAGLELEMVSEDKEEAAPKAAPAKAGEAQVTKPGQVAVKQRAA